MKLKNVNKQKYGKQWKQMIWELTNSSIWKFSVKNIDFSQTYKYKDKIISFKKVIINNEFYYEIIVDNKIIDDHFYRQLLNNVDKRILKSMKYGFLLHLILSFLFIMIFIISALIIKAF